MVKKLLLRRLKKGGRNRTGTLVVKGRGGGFKQKNRIVDIYQNLYDIRGRILKIRYDPTRNSNLGIILYDIGCLSFNILPNLIKKDDYILSSLNQVLKIKPGNSMPIKNIPLGTSIFNIESVPGYGGKLARAAGSRAVIFQRFFKYSGIILPSGEVKYVDNNSMASIGVVNNSIYWNIDLKKAGYFRRKGFKPKVRGVAMNTIDHVHGGGHCISASYNKKVLKNKKTKSTYKIKLFNNFKRCVSLV